jgi:hypothetical protein
MTDSTHRSEREAGMATDVYPGKDLGTLDLTNVRWPNEPFTTRGVITSRTEDQERTRAHVTVVCEKVDGIKIIVAAASALENI